MKVTELMALDYVKYKNAIVKVITIDAGSNMVWIDSDDYSGLVKVDNIEPIPLNKEILEKNGWHEPKNAWMILREGCNELNIMLGEHYTELEYMNMAYNPEDPDEVNYGSSFEFPRVINVHELQHIMKICEFEKEIVL